MKKNLIIFFGLLISLILVVVIFYQLVRLNKGPEVSDGSQPGNVITQVIIIQPSTTQTLQPAIDFNGVYPPGYVPPIETPRPTLPIIEYKRVYPPGYVTETDTPYPSFTPRPTIDYDPNNPDIIAIKNTLQSFADLKNNFYFTMDDSKVDQILANDPRGGLVNEGYLKLVRYMKGDPNLKIENIGYLDVYECLYAYEIKAKKIFDAAVARGEITIPTPMVDDSSANPATLTAQALWTSTPTVYEWLYTPPPNSEMLPEIRAMEQAAGFRIYFPLSMEDKKNLLNYVLKFSLMSVSIQGDLAHIKTDWNYALVDDILVKKAGHWYLVGEKTLLDHGA